jgi:V8-like Glu-specific endopeptidase
VPHPRTSTLRPALGATFAALVTASAGDARAIVGGAPDTTHGAVVAIQPVPPTCGEAPSVTQCTGTLVAPRLVVTAAHCLNAVDNAQLMEVTFAANVATATSADRLRAIDARIDPSWTAGVDDVAVLRLAEDAPVAPVALDLASPAMTAATVLVVGFGADDQNDTGRRLSGTALVGAVRAGDFDITAAPAMTCGGDSGGPAFEDDGTGERFVGITSYGNEACTTGTDMRVDALASFLTPAMSQLSVAVPPRPALDPSVDTCVATCATHADCPIGMWCVTRDDGTDGTRACAIASLTAGHFGADCTQSDGNTICVNAGAGCRLWLPCPAPPPGAPTLRAGGGCAVLPKGGSGGWGGAWAAVVLAALLARTRSYGPVARQTRSLNTDLKSGL